jgi:small basic protein (TIGR04137 family)
MDRTLKSSGGLTGRRAVLTRAERIDRMIEEGNFDPKDDSPFGLPKLRIRSSRAGSKKKEEEAPEVVEGAEGAEGAEAAEGEAAEA